MSSKEKANNHILLNKKPAGEGAGAAPAGGASGNRKKVDRSGWKLEAGHLVGAVLLLILIILAIVAALDFWGKNKEGENSEINQTKEQMTQAIDSGNDGSIDWALDTTYEKIEEESDPKKRLGLMGVYIDLWKKLGDISQALEDLSAVDISHYDKADKLEYYKFMQSHYAENEDEEGALEYGQKIQELEAQK